MKKYKIGKESNDKQTEKENTKETSIEKNNKKDEATKEKIDSGPSTPKKSKVIPDDNNGTPESNYSDYNDVFALTQDKSIDVTWDWNSTPKSKKNKDRTPKRTTVIHKKRISNSPLLYNSTKRKIIRKDNTNNLDKLKADMIALQATITKEKNAPHSGAARSSNGNDNDSDNDDKDVDIPEELKFDDDFDDETVLVVSLSANSTLTNICGGDDDKKKDIDDRFDDSMNDTMIRCSQEIEKNLKITPPNGNQHNSNSSNTNNGLNPVSCFSRSKSSNEFKNLPSTSKCQPQNNYKSIHVSKPQTNSQAKPSVSKLVPEDSHTKFIKHKSEPINNAQNNIESVDDGFPDDLFDDFYSSSETDLKKTESIVLTGQSTNSNHFGKVYSPKGESTSKTITKQPNSFLPRVPNKSSTSFPSVQSVNCTVTNRNVSVPTMRPTGTIPKNPSMYNNNHSSNSYNNNNNNNSNSNNNRAFQRTGSSTNLRPNAPENVNTPKKSQEWKFFKSKSISDSSFEHKINSKPGLPDTKSHSNLRNNFKANTNLNSRGGCRMFAGGSVSNDHLAVRRATTCLDSGKKNIVKDNTQLYNNVDRCGGRRNEGLSVSKNNDTIRQPSVLSAKGVSSLSSSSSSSSSSRDVSVSMQSLQLCTREEIERKRIEAKMKLEARKKRLQASNSDSSANSLRSNERLSK